MSIPKRQHGFTLIEIAIVLVIIGLLLGGILKGQELITSARVRNLISQQDGIKAAFYGFQDRYRAFPGDYSAAPTNLGGAGTISRGNGNGQIEAAATPDTVGTPASVANEDKLAWDHLSRAGFLNGNFVYNSADDSPKNPYGQTIQLAYDQIYGAGTSASTTPSKRHNLKTGALVPVEIMAEVDRKTDDGAPYSGSFQFSGFSSPETGCLIGDTTKSWNLQGGATNCGAATLL
jgi:prepilin-type N-terminal cleavage/methylation domain-containing protein